MSSHLNNGGACNALIQLPNSQLAASSGNVITIWSPLTNINAPLRNLSGHSGSVYDLALSPDGSILASASQDRTIRIWNYASSSTALKKLTGHTNEVRAVCFVSNQILASGSSDMSIKIWNVSSGMLNNKFLKKNFFLKNPNLIKIL
jgi:WD40 repeat protein